LVFSNPGASDDQKALIFLSPFFVALDSIVNPVRVERVAGGLGFSVGLALELL
jgi:hypothetical protein